VCTQPITSVLPLRGCTIVAQQSAITYLLLLAFRAEAWVPVISQPSWRIPQRDRPQMSVLPLLHSQLKDRSRRRCRNACRRTSCLRLRRACCFRIFCSVSFPIQSKRLIAREDSKRASNAHGTMLSDQVRIRCGAHSPTCGDQTALRRCCS